MPVRVNRQSRLEAILSLIAVPTRLQYSLYANKVKCMVNYESLRYGSCIVTTSGDKVVKNVKV